MQLSCKKKKESNVLISEINTRQKKIGFKHFHTDQTPENKINIFT